MTPQFTTPCFIRKNTPELRTKLEELGRKCFMKEMSLFDYLFTIENMWSSFGKDFVNQLDPNYIDCGTNEALFLALAGMRSDTTLNQYFVCEDRYTDPVLDYQIVEVETMLKQGEFDEYAKSFYHLATTQEIINHFKSLEK